VKLSDEWQLKSAFTWTDAIDTDLNRQLSSVVPIYSALQIRYRNAGGFFALLQLRSAGARTGVSGYTVGDLNIGLPIGNGLQLTFSISNLFNSFYRESLIGFNAPGTQFFVGVRSGGIFKVSFCILLGISAARAISF
jgi:outer membrane receptor protein involved in Fe transport